MTSWIRLRYRSPCLAEVNRPSQIQDGVLNTANALVVYDHLLTSRYLNGRPIVDLKYLGNDVRYIGHSCNEILCDLSNGVIFNDHKWPQRPVYSDTTQLNWTQHYWTQLNSTQVLRPDDATQLNWTQLNWTRRRVELSCFAINTPLGRVRRISP